MVCQEREVQEDNRHKKRPIIVHGAASAAAASGDALPTRDDVAFCSSGDT